MHRTRSSAASWRRLLMALGVALIGIFQLHQSAVVADNVDDVLAMYSPPTDVDAPPPLHATSVVRVVLVGATGDLATRVLWVSLFRLAMDAFTRTSTEILLPHDNYAIEVVAAATDDAAQGEQWLRQWLALDGAFATRVCGAKPSENTCGWKKAQPRRFQCWQFFEHHFRRSVTYAPLQHEADYAALSAQLATTTLTSLPEIGRVVYLAIPPQFFLTATQWVHDHLRPTASSASTSSRSPFLRVVIEKPFGRDVASATALAERVRAVLAPEEVVLIDHYAGKRAVRALDAFLKANRPWLARFWTKNVITRVEARLTEVMSCAGRIPFYHQTGVIRDVMVSHLQLLLLSAIAPLTATPETHSSDRVAFLQSLHQQPHQQLVVGQYDDYTAQFRREMNDSDPDMSINDIRRTPTAAYVEFSSASSPWRDTIFAFSAGKSMKRREASLRIVFEHEQFSRSPCELRVTIQQGKTKRDMKEKIEWTCGLPKGAFPDVPEGWRHQLTPSALTLTPKPLTNAQPWTLGLDNAYDQLLADVIDGNHDSFMDLDELVAAWTFWSPIVEAAEAATPPNSVVRRVYKSGALEGLQLYAQQQPPNARSVKEEL